MYAALHHRILALRSRVEQEQEVKNVAPEPEVTQSNEEDSDDDVIAPSGSVGSGKQERQQFSVFHVFFFKADCLLCNCILYMYFWPVTSHTCLWNKTHCTNCLFECNCFLLLLQTGKKAPVLLPSELRVTV